MVPTGNFEGYTNSLHAGAAIARPAALPDLQLAGKFEELVDHVNSILDWNVAARGLLVLGLDLDSSLPPLIEKHSPAVV